MKKESNIYACNVIELNTIHNRAGNITFIEGESDLPFNIKRIFFLYDVPGGAERGGHAHINLHQFMVAASGCFDVILDDGNNRKMVQLNRPNYGIHIPPLIWVEVVNFSSGAISLNLVSYKYIEEDYIRDYSTFLKLRK